MQKSGLATVPGGTAVVASAVALSIAGLGWIMMTIPVVPALDLPNHAARLHVLAHADHFAALGFYEVVWSLQPNIALDWIYATLLPGTDVYAFTRGWFWLAFTLFVTGSIALRYALCRHVSVLTPLLPVLFFSYAVRLGFLNYLMALALLFWSLAAQIAMRERPLWERLGAGTLCSLALYFCHPFGLAMYGLVAGLFAISEAYEHGSRRLVRAVMGLGVVLGQTVIALSLALMHFSANQSALTVRYLDLLQHLTTFRTVFDGYDWAFQLAMVTALIGFGVLVLVRPRTSDERPILHPWLVVPVLALIAISLIMPWRIGESGALTSRLYPAAATLAVIGLRDDFLDWCRARIVLAVAVGLLAWKMIGIAGNFSTSARAHSQVIETVRALPVQGRLVSFMPYQPHGVTTSSSLLSHSVAYAVVERDALVPTLFANPSQQPLRYAANYEALRRDVTCLQDWHFIGTDWDHIRAQYDHVLVLSHEGAASHWDTTLLAEGFRPVSSTAHAALYRLAAEAEGPRPQLSGPATRLAQCWAYLADPAEFEADFDFPLDRLRAADEAVLGQP